MTQIDNSKIFLEGVYADVSVKNAANTTLEAGTVLGRNSSGDLVAFSTDNNVAASEGVPAFTTDPLFILAQKLVNSTASAETVAMVRVFDGGVVNKDKIIFVKTADKTNKTVLDALRKNEFKLEAVQELSEATSLRN